MRRVSSDDGRCCCGYDSGWRCHDDGCSVGEAREDGVHERSAGGARERIPLQPLPVSTATNRARLSTQPLRATDQNLVPKSTHEAQERLGLLVIVVKTTSQFQTTVAASHNYNSKKIKNWYYLAARGHTVNVLTSNYHSHFCLLQAVISRHCDTTIRSRENDFPCDMDIISIGRYFRSPVVAPRCEEGKYFPLIWNPWPQFASIWGKGGILNFNK